MNQSDILCPHVSYFVWVAVKPQKIVAGSDVQLHYLCFLHILELFLSLDTQQTLWAQK